MAKFGANPSIIVGENNVGKSTVLKTIGVLAGTEALSEKDFHKVDKEKEITIKGRFILDSDEIDELVGKVLTQYAKERINLLRELFKQITFAYSSSKGFFIQLDDCYIFGNTFSTQSKLPAGGIIHVPLASLLDIYVNSKEYLTLAKIVKKTSDEKKATAFAIEIDIVSGFQKLLTKKYKVFSEIRQNPRGENSDVPESYDGRYVADVLFRLKNGNLAERRRWRLIKESFQQFFPTLQIEIGKTKNTPPEISIEKLDLGFEIPIGNVGVGIGETIILITHLIATRGYIFGLEMPELHFHPHSQRLLKRFLSSYSRGNQFIITTHSPIFIDESHLESLILVREVKGVTSLQSLQEFLFSSTEKFQIARQLDVSSKELFFSRKVLLVEGETELGAFPAFSSYLGKDFDLLGISMVKTGKHFGLTAKLLISFRIPFLAVCDKDALIETFRKVRFKRGKKNVEVLTSAVFCNLFKAAMITKKDLGFLAGIESKILNSRYPEDIFNELRDKCLPYNIYVLSSDFEGVLTADPKIMAIYTEAKSFSDSKVTIGRYTAERICRKKLKMPKEFAEVIQKIDQAR